MGQASNNYGSNGKNNGNGNGMPGIPLQGKFPFAASGATDLTCNKSVPVEDGLKLVSGLLGHVVEAISSQTMGNVEHDRELGVLQTTTSQLAAEVSELRKTLLAAISPKNPGKAERDNGIGNLHTTVTQLGEQISEMRKSLVDAVKPVMEQNSKYRNREVDELVIRPLAVGLIHMLDRNKSDATSKDYCEGCGSYVEDCRKLDRSEIEGMLEILGVIPIKSAAGGSFNPALHTAPKTQPTKDKTKVDTIISVIRDGYHRHTDGLLIRRAMVEVYSQG